MGRLLLLLVLRDSVHKRHASAAGVPQLGDADCGRLHGAAIRAEHGASFVKSSGRMERATRHCKPSDVCGGRARREASLTHACVCVGVSVLVGHRRSTRWGACGSLTRAGCVSLALRSCVTHAHPCHTRASLLPYTSPFAALVPRMSPPVPCVARLQINFFAKSNSSIVNGPPKLVIWDLATNVKLREYVFTNAVASCACVDCAAYGVHVRWPCFAAHVRWPCFVRVPRRRP